MNKAKKNIITLSVLSALLVAIILVYIFVVSPLLNEEGGENELPVPQKGEGLYGERITMYPEIEEDMLRQIEVTNEKGTFTFHRYWNEDKGKYEMKIKGHEEKTFDAYAFAYLNVYVTLPFSLDREPLRNVSPERLEEYGVTKDTARATYKVTYMDGDEEKSYTVYIGNQAFSDDESYYATVEGRDSVYRLQSGVDECFFLSLEEYVEPIIFNKFDSSLTVLTGITQFSIFTSDMIVDDNGDVNLNNIVNLVSPSDERTETSAFFYLYYERAGKTMRTLADSDYLSEVFTYLYTSFSGEKTVAVNPTLEQRQKYGLSEGQEMYLISAVFDEKDSNALFYISREIDGYHYVLSSYYGTDKQMIVAVPKDEMSFLEAKNEKWAATNSVLTGFYEYLLPNDEEKEPGVKELTIKTRNNEETFYIEYNEVTKGVKITTKNSGLIFESTDGTGTQFNNLYAFLVHYPMPIRFNSLSDEEREELLAGDTLEYELLVELRDGTLLRYSYYKLSANYLMCQTQQGKDGVWGETNITFDTTMEHVEKVTGAFDALLRGEEINPEDGIH